MNKRNLIKRIIASPFLFIIILIGYIFNAFRQWYLVVKYGGEWITYLKDDPKYIEDIYKELKTNNEKRKH